MDDSMALKVITCLQDVRVAGSRWCVSADVGFVEPKISLNCGKSEIRKGKVFTCLQEARESTNLFAVV